MHTATSLSPITLITPSLEALPISEGVKVSLFTKEISPPTPRALSVETIRRLRADFQTKSHAPSSAMWNAITDIVQTVEQMANGTAEPSLYLSSLDPGVGKTQSIIQFLPVMLSSQEHDNVAVIICAGRLKQIEDVVRDARNAGLKDEDFAVFTSDADLNKLGRRIEDRENARVLFTTHSMVTGHCERAGSFTKASDFHYRGQPRQVRVWDEAITPGVAVTLSRIDITRLIKPAFNYNASFGNRLDRLADQLSRMTDRDQFVAPDLEVECGIDLNGIERLFRSAPDDLKAANELWLLSGKMVTVRREGVYGNAILDFRETLPPGLAPLLVLDASSRHNVRETYNLWEKGRGGIIRLREAPKDYAPLTVHHWAKGGGKTAFKDPISGARLVRGIASTINSKPTEKWLVIHHKDDQFATKVRMLVDGGGSNVAFLNWGAHDATNDYADVPNVILAGTLFYRSSQYEGMGRAAAGLPSSAGAFPEEDYQRVRSGEHRHMILQAICRGRVRKCVSSQCPPASVYIIAAPASGIAGDLPSIFPGCSVVKWQPEERQLEGKVGDAVSFIVERTRGGAFVSNVEVKEHLEMADGSNYRKDVRKHADFIAALDEEDVVECKDGRRFGFRLRVATFFGEVGEA